jgi:hypothetical protein
MNGFLMVSKASAATNRWNIAAKHMGWAQVGRLPFGNQHLASARRYLLGLF